VDAGDTWKAKWEKDVDLDKLTAWPNGFFERNDTKVFGHANFDLADVGFSSF
jgi:hypothetical protein